jgi:2,3-bisphosphoglycerate-independent phosphoglycerate mutase
MKQYRWIMISGVLCLVLVAIAYFWATAMMDSLYAYRSPLHATPPQPGEPIGEPLTWRVVFILVDGLTVETSHDEQVMPFLNQLRAQSAWATMHSRAPSYSAPGYSVLLIGAWPDLSDGPALNLPYEDTPTFTQDNLFSAAHRAGLNTAVSAYYWFEKLIPQEAVTDGYFTAGEDHSADLAVTAAAVPWLRSGEHRLTLIHLDQVDYAGHYEGGPRDPRWNEAAARVDGLLAELVSELDLAQDTVLITSDHGHILRGGHGGHDPVTLQEPFILLGAGVQPGRYPDVQMVDVAPTLAALLGTNIPATSQGQILFDMLVLEPGRRQALQTALVAQQSRLLEMYMSFLGRQATVESSDDPVASHQFALQQAYQTRVNQERNLRMVALLILGLSAAVLIWQKRSRTMFWLFSAALIYLFVFNFRYAVLDGMTYSLSSVTSADAIILYTGASAAWGLLISWIAVMTGFGLKRLAPRRAVELTLALALTVAFVLALPIAWSWAMNGAVVTWALPDFASSYLAFLSLIQILFVGLLALPLAGLAAVTAAVFKQLGQPEKEPLANS